MQLTTRERQLIKKYDKPETVVVVSSYPDKHGESARLNAISNYTRELACEMSKKIKIVVIAEVLTKPEFYEEDGVLVVRAYSRGHMLLTAQVVQAISMFNQATQVVMQFEFGVYGGSLVTFSTSLLGLLTKFLNKKYTVMVHQVTDDLGELAEHLGISTKSIKTYTYNMGMRLFYILTGLFADKLLVHNEYLGEKLSRYVRSEKISVVPHGVSNIKKVNRDKARKSLNIKSSGKMILVFGYLSWYKGSDWVIEHVGNFAKRNPGKNIKLVMAGGESGTLKEMEHYKKYIKSVKRLAHKYETTITGYVPDNEKAKYFAAADLVIMPHRVAMSESGVMAHVMSYGKSYLASSARGSSLGREGNLPQIFEINRRGDFEKKLESMLADGKLSKRVAKEIKELGKSRSWNAVAQKYLAVLPREKKTVYTGAKYAEVNI